LLIYNYSSFTSLSATFIFAPEINFHFRRIWYERPGAEKWSRFMAPVSGACDTAIILFSMWYPVYGIGGTPAWLLSCTGDMWMITNLPYIPRQSMVPFSDKA